MNQVIIIGASGLLGSQLTKTFLNQNYKVLAVFNQRADLVISGVDNFQCDVSDREAVLSLLNKIEPSSLIIHCAAITKVDLCEKEKELCRAVNIGGIKNVSELALKTHSQLIYISTSSVFDGKKGNYTELDKTNPVNYYNLSKIEGEKHVFNYDKGIVVRAIHIGLHIMGRKPSSFLEWLVNSLKNNLDISLFSDVKMNPLSVNTMADLITKIPKKMDNGIIHLGSRNIVSKSDIGLEVMKFFPKYSGKFNLISIDDNKQGFASRPKEMWLNISKAESLELRLPEALPDIKQYLNEKKIL